MNIIGAIMVVGSFAALGHSLWASIREGEKLGALIRDNWWDIILFGSIAMAGAGLIVGDALI